MTFAPVLPKSDRLVNCDTQLSIEKNTTGATIIFSAFKNIVFTGVRTQASSPCAAAAGSSSRRMRPSAIDDSSAATVQYSSRRSDSFTAICTMLQPPRCLYRSLSRKALSSRSRMLASAWLSSASTSSPRQRSTSRPNSNCPPGTEIFNERLPITLTTDSFASAPGAACSNSFTMTSSAMSMARLASLERIRRFLSAAVMKDMPSGMASLLAGMRRLSIFCPSFSHIRTILNQHYALVNRCWQGHDPQVSGASSVRASLSSGIPVPASAPGCAVVSTPAGEPERISITVSWSAV